MIVDYLHLGRDDDAVSALHVLEHEHPEVEIVDEGVGVLAPGAGGGQGGVGGVPTTVTPDQLHLAVSSRQRFPIMNPVNKHML